MRRTFSLRSLPGWHSEFLRTVSTARTKMYKRLQASIFFLLLQSFHDFHFSQPSSLTRWQPFVWFIHERFGCCVLALASSTSCSNLHSLWVTWREKNESFPKEARKSKIYFHLFSELKFATQVKRGEKRYIDCESGMLKQSFLKTMKFLLDVLCPDETFPAVFHKQTLFMNKLLMNIFCRVFILPRNIKSVTFVRQTREVCGEIRSR